MERAIALREEQPARTTSTLVDILEREEGLQLKRTLNAHTLTSQLRRRGKTRRLLSQGGRYANLWRQQQLEEELELA